MIPEMTDPLGAHWRQPAREAILLDDTHAVMTPETAAMLAAYDWSTPTGCYPGKMWRCREWLCWFGEENERGYCAIHSREILIVDEESCA